MNDQLKDQYISFLKYYGLKPRSIPANREALEKATFEHLLDLSRDDDFTSNLLKEAYEKNKETYAKSSLHPADILIRKAVNEVEEVIHSIERYKGKLNVDVYAGEFPTGSINAQAVQVDGGFLILVNSGLMIVTKQIVEFLVMGDPDRPTDIKANRDTIDGIVSVLSAYIKYDDPFYGPKPLTGGIKQFLAHALTHKCQLFIVAHEYGHIIAGHFDEQALKLETISPKLGKVDVVKKSYQQEFEADLIAHKIILGVDDYDDFDTVTIDKAFDPNEVDSTYMANALMLKAGIAAPFIVLTIDNLLRDIALINSNLNNTLLKNDTHPPSRQRMDNLTPSFSKLNSKYSGFVNYASIMWANYEHILKKLVQQFS